MSDPADVTRLRLRYPGTCRECAAELAPGTTARYDRAAKQVVCLDCSDAAGRPTSTGDGVSGLPVARGPALAPPSAPPAEASASAPPPADRAVVSPGTAGASARREFERRVVKREQRIRERHPELGGLFLALSDDPQSTTAWQRGALAGRVADLHRTLAAAFPPA